MSKNPLNELYSRKWRDSNAWLNIAQHLKLSAEVILKHLFEVSENSSASQAVKLNKKVAFMESYMMLTGFAFENLLKGIDIGREPSLIDDNKLRKKRWPRNGHGISKIAHRIDEKLSAKEIDLFKRLEEFIYWAGRYPVSIKATEFSNSIEPENLTTYKPTDPELVDRLFKQFSKTLIEEIKERRNQHDS
jgi:hypothetical protein